MLGVRGGVAGRSHPAEAAGTEEQETGAEEQVSEIADKVRSLGTGFNKGKSKTTRVVDDRDGSTAGRQTEHWDDRLDAVAMPKTARFELKLTGG